MKINRLFEIIYLLMNRGTLTAREMAEHFEVSTRTIHRDIESLMQAGIPIYATRGSQGGYSLIDGFVLDKAVLSEEEQMHVLLSLQSFSAAGQFPKSEAFPRLLSFFNQPETDWIEVDFSRWGQQYKDNERFDLIKQAILEHRSLTFEYVSSKGVTSKREVYPLKLVFKSKTWYLQAFCLLRDAHRIFRITRMLDLEVEDTKFDREEYRVPAFEITPDKPFEMLTLDLVFKPHTAARVYDEFDPDCIEVLEDGRIHVHTLYPEEEYLYVFLGSFGKDVEVLSPQSVIDEFARTAS